MYICALLDHFHLVHAIYEQPCLARPLARRRRRHVNSLLRRETLPVVAVGLPQRVVIRAAVERAVALVLVLAQVWDGTLLPSRLLRWDSEITGGMVECYLRRKLSLSPASHTLPVLQVPNQPRSFLVSTLLQ